MENVYRIVVKSGDKFGAINEKGDLVVPLIFDRLYNFAECGLAACQIVETKKWGFIGTDGKIVIEPRFETVFSFTSWNQGRIHRALVRLNGLYGFIDHTGRIVIEPSFSDASTFVDGLARVERAGKWGYIDMNGKEVVPIRFDSVDWFDRGLAVIRVDGKAGVVDKTGKIIAEPRYRDVDRTSFVRGDYIYVWRDPDFCGLLDMKGREVLPTKYRSIQVLDLEGGFVVTDENWKQWLLDSSGKPIVETAYDSIGAIVCIKRIAK
jgi:hypothetical protein